MTFDKDTNSVFSELVGSHLQESEGQDKCNAIDCGPFDNPRQAYLWIQSFTGSMSMLMRRDPNYQQIKKTLTMNLKPLKRLSKKTTLSTWLLSVALQL